MYGAFFGFREQPFSPTPDPKFLYLNASSREALAALRYGVSERKGFVSLIGEAGTGKTTLLRRLLAELPAGTRSVLVLNPAVEFEELLRFILLDLGQQPKPGQSKLEMLEALNAELLDTLARGGNVVVLIDEAQDLAVPVLEELRLLSNLETAKEKILQLVLAGQSELETTLARPEIRQLRQRIAVRARLRPLRRAEVRAYVATRVAAAGGDERGLFSAAAFHRLWRFSGGVPRLVNVACDNALLTAYAAGRRSVGWREVGEATRDFRPPRRRLALGAAAAAAVIAVAVALGVSAARRDGAPGPEPRAEKQVPSPLRADERALQESADGGRPRLATAGVSSEEGTVPAERSALERARGLPAGVSREGEAAGTSRSASGAVVVGGSADAAAQEQAGEPMGRGPQAAAPPPDGRPGSPDMPASGAAAPLAGAEVWSAPTARAPERPPGGVRFRVRRGDTLSGIVRRHYGNASPLLMERVRLANPALGDLDVLAVGQTLVLPVAARPTPERSERQ